MRSCCPDYLESCACSTPAGARPALCVSSTMLVMLSLSTLWMASCGGTSSNKDPGTPTGSFPSR